MNRAISYLPLPIGWTAAFLACLPLCVPVWAQPAQVTGGATAESIPAAPSDPIGEALVERLNQVIPEDLELFSDENGWQRYIASTTVSDLQLTWRGMPDEDRDTLARAVRAGRTLLCIQAEDEKLLALSLMDFESPELAARFVTAAQTMNATQFAAPPPGSAASAESEPTLDSSDASAAESSSAPKFEDLKQRRFDLGTLKDAAETTVMMTVPGSPPAPTRILRAQIGTSACELLVVRLDQDADNQQIEAWLKQAIQSLDLPSPPEAPVEGANSSSLGEDASADTPAE